MIKLLSGTPDEVKLAFIQLNLPIELVDKHYLTMTIITHPKNETRHYCWQYHNDILQVSQYIVKLTCIGEELDSQGDWDYCDLLDKYNAKTLPAMSLLEELSYFDESIKLDLSLYPNLHTINGEKIIR